MVSGSAFPVLRGLIFLLLIQGSLFATRVGIVETGEKTELEPVLIAALSSEPSLELLGREDLGRILEEGQLRSLAGASRFKELGTLAHAEALLIVETLPVNGGKSRRSARLIDVRTGYCQFFAFVPNGHPGDAEFDEWVAWLKKALMARFQGAKERVPVSMLNIRASEETAAGREAERAFSRLVEQALANDPGVLLLERRALRDVAFERSLDAADAAPFETGVLILDGALEGREGAWQVTMRLRKADGTDFKTLKATVSDPVKGSSEIFAQLCESLKVKGEKTTQAWEGGEFLREARWAYRVELPFTGLEALAAAESLGLASPDVFALRVRLIGLALKKDAKGGKPDVANEGLLIEEALEYLEKYNRVASKEDVALSAEVLDRASAYLAARDAEGASGQGDLRRRLRSLARMDAEGGPLSLALAGRYSNTWAEDLPQLMAMYRRLLTIQHKWLRSALRNFPRTTDAVLGPRFRKDPRGAEEWNRLGQDLLRDPKVRCRMLLLLAGYASTDKERAYYRDFLNETRERAKELVAADELSALLEANLINSEDYHRERTLLIISLLENFSKTNTGVLSLPIGTHVPDDLRPKVAEAFAGFSSRMMAAASSAKERVETERRLSDLARNILLGTPGIRLDTADAGLAVETFWQPFDWAPEEVGSFLYGNNNYVVQPDCVWINSGYLKNCVVRVSLPDLTVTKYPVHGYSMLVGQDALYMTQEDREKSLLSVLRYQIQTGESESTLVPSYGEQLILGNRLFWFSPSSCTMWEIDFKNPPKVLFSARRRPAETPLDDRKKMFPRVALFSGFKNQPLIAVFGESSIRKFGGDWAQVQTLQWPAVFPAKSDTLVTSPWNGAFLYGPSHETPVCLLAGEKPEGHVAVHGWRDPVENAQERDYAWRDGELFRLESSSSGRYSLRWWYIGGPPEGLSVPLQFRMADAAKQSVTKASKDFLDHFNLDRALRPTYLSFFAADSGLVFLPGAYGFWFIPNSDLQKWKAQNPVPAATRETARKD